MSSSLNHGVTAAVGADEALEFFMLSSVLLVIVIPDGRLGEMYPLQHHYVFFNLTSLLILSHDIVERANLMRSSNAAVAVESMRRALKSRSRRL